MAVQVALAIVCLSMGCSAMPCYVQGVQSGSWCVVNSSMTMYHRTRLVLACMLKLTGLEL